MLTPPAVIFAISQMTSPAGAATAAALPRTKSVRSNTDRTSTFPICGFRYGGSSSVKEDGTPLSRISDSSFVTANVMPTPSTIAAVRSSADSTGDSPPPAVPTKNMVSRAISVGKRPLHGTKLLVSIASSRSLGESMMRQPTTPAALQPKPMHMVSACFPQARQRLKGLSRLYATLGR